MATKDMTTTAVPPTPSLTPSPGQQAAAEIGPINTIKPPSGPRDATLYEYGRVGQRRVGGFFNEEFLVDLRGRKGIQTYTEMINNDEVIGAVSTTIELLIRQASWHVEPGGKKTQVDRKAAEFVESCLHDMQDTWSMTLAEILSFIPYGWSFHEICYKIRRGIHATDERWRSKFDDGLIGWLKLPIRAQDTLYQWQMDERDNVRGIIQVPPPSYRWCTIPIEKALHFRTTSYKNHPEGRSIWRRAYRAWYFKKRIQEIEGIGIERDLAGFPVMTGPQDMDLYDENDEQAKKHLAYAQTVVTNIRRDAMEGLVLPHGWELTLLASTGRRAIDTNQVITRYNTGMAMTGLADFIMLGHTKVGTFSLADSKTSLFGLAMGAYLDMIAETFNSQAIPRLMELNADAFKGMTGYPELQHGDLESPDLAELGTYVKDLTGCGALMPDGDMEEYLREVGGLPKANNLNPDGTPREPRQVPNAQAAQGGGKKVNTPSADGEEEGVKPTKPTVGAAEEDDEPPAKLRKVYQELGRPIGEDEFR